MTLIEIERRLTELEATIAELRTANGRNRRWWVDDAGRFANDPVFDEIVRLGRAYRRSLRPRRKPKSRAS